ncbi:MAG TPA: MFS transporter [Roseiflexaceae bacterium]|nr:MFS transporter [Roseiflexaceae bacterium]
MRSRNVVLLSVSQALGSAGITLMVLLGGIIGADIAPAPTLATLPISIQILGVAVSTVPAAFLMRRYGRRGGFVGSALLAALAALLAAYAVARGSFALFCAATFFTGMNGAFVQQYRFAASESVEPRDAGRAVSLVLVGGIFAGVLGPELARRTKDLLPMGLYTGSFVSLALLYTLSAALLVLLKDIRPPARAALGDERPVGRVVAQPVYLVALISGVVAYGVMSFTMTATPIQLNRISGFTLDQTAWVIQSHVVAMFLPSLFTGSIMDRLGVLRVMFAGVLLLGLCVLLGLVSHHLLHFWGALVLLGVGWNFLYVGATVLLTQSYRPAERFKAQAINDFTIFGVQALASLSAGTIIFSAGWVILNLITLPFLIVTLGALLLLRAHGRLAGRAAPALDNSATVPGEGPREGKALP